MVFYRCKGEGGGRRRKRGKGCVCLFYLFNKGVGWAYISWALWFCNWVGFGLLDLVLDYKR